MKKLLQFIPIFLVFSSSGCEYESHDVFERDINENAPPPEVIISSLNLPEDTIHISENIQIKYVFTSPTAKILGVKLIYDGFELRFNQGSGTGYFWIPYTSVTQGIHYLTIEVYTSSNTGSIAAFSGIENYIFTRSWVLIKNLKSGFVNFRTDNGQNPALGFDPNPRIMILTK
jgi:hypothetical protein